MRRFLAVLTREAQWIDVDVQITACRDPKDDKFLSLAVRGQATHIVTGDADLLALHPFQGVRIVTPWHVSGGGIAGKALSAMFGRDHATTNVEQKLSIESLPAFRTGVELSVPKVEIHPSQGHL
jgi:PIN domain